MPDNNTDTELNPFSESVGVIYLIAGIVGMVLNVMCAILIQRNKELKNSSYFYIVHLCWADAFSSSAIAFYPGLVLLIPLHTVGWTTSLPVAWAERIFNLLLQLGWYPSGYFFVLISLNRLFMLKYNHKEKSVFTKKMLYGSAILIWVGFGAFTSVNLYYPDLVAYFFVKFYTWNLNMDHWYGRGISTFNLVHDIQCSFFNIVFNVMSVMWIRKTMKQVQSVENASNRKREIKLFTQCLITSSFYTGTCIGHGFVYFFAQCCMVPYHFLIAHIFWISNHIVSPIIYLIYNPKLRAMIREKMPSSIFNSTTTNVSTISQRGQPAKNGNSQRQQSQP